MGRIARARDALLQQPVQAAQTRWIPVYAPFWMALERAVVEVSTHSSRLRRVLEMAKLAWEILCRGRTADEKYAGAGHAVRAVQLALRLIGLIELERELGPAHDSIGVEVALEDVRTTASAFLKCLNAEREARAFTTSVGAPG